MKKVLKISLGVLFLLILCGTFAFLWYKTRPVKEVYQIVVPRTDTIEKRAVATGKVEPRDEVLIKPQISGIISEIYKEAGEQVRQGEVIAKVKVIPEMATLNSAESRVNVARISLDQTRRDFDRVKELYGSGVISKEEFETSQTTLSKAEEEMQNAKDNLEIVQNGIASRNAELSNTQIRSTITGMILDVPVKVGNSVIQSNTFNDGTTIASIADLNDMIFRGKVDETEVGRLREGMPVKLTIGALQDVALNAGVHRPERSRGERRDHVRDQSLHADTARSVRPGGIQRERGDRDRPAGRRADGARERRRVRGRQNVRQPAYE